MKLGLDELMIVNPGAGDLEVKGPSSRVGPTAPAQYFLGADLSLYQVQEVASAELAGADEPVGGFFVGDDGTLYQVVPERPR